MNLRLASAWIVVAATVAVGCDQTRQVTAEDRATEGETTVQSEQIVGTWRIENVESNVDIGDAGSAEEKVNNKWVRLEVPAESSDTGPTGRMTATVCTVGGCDGDGYPYQLDRVDGHWTGEFATANPVVGRSVAANICRMKVVEWLLRPISETFGPKEVPKVELAFVERVGTLILEGDARCRPADAIEMVDRLDEQTYRRVWTLVRADEQGDGDSSG